MRSLGSLFSLFVVDLGVNSNLGLIFAPFSDEKLILIVVKVTALALALTVDPVAFEMVTVSFGENAIAVALALVPLAFVDILVGVDHTAFSLGMAVDPVSVVSISVCVEEGSTTVATVFIPVASILTTEFSTVISPEGSLTVLLIHGPHSFVLVSILVVLDSEAFLAVVSPVADVSGGALPLLALDCTVFLFILFLDPVN